MKDQDISTVARQSTGRRGRWSVVFRILRSGLVIYLLVVLAMLFLENLLIFPAPRYPSGNWEPGYLEPEDAYFESPDGTKLHGWYVAHPNPLAHVMFCHGNAEHVANLAPLLESYRDDFNVTIFAFDYRGYGRSEGRAHEAGVLADGRAAQEWFADRAGIEASEIILVGRSLGGAVAVDLAAAMGARGLVLERTFTKMPDIAARLYPFLPIRLLMKTQFDSEDKIQKYSGPLLQSHGTADRVIPFDLGQQLFEAAPSENKQFISEKGAGHNDPYSFEYLKELNRFLSELPDAE